MFHNFVLSEIKVYYLKFPSAGETMTHMLYSEEVQNQLTGWLKKFTWLLFWQRGNGNLKCIFLLRCTADVSRGRDPQTRRSAGTTEKGTYIQVSLSMSSITPFWKGLFHYFCNIVNSSPLRSACNNYNQTCQSICLLYPDDSNPRKALPLSLIQRNNKGCKTVYLHQLAHAVPKEMIHLCW